MKLTTQQAIEERLIEDYGFEKTTFEHNEFTTNRYENDGLSIDFDYEEGKVVSIDAKIETLISNPNINNLEAFIKAYFGLFEK